MRVILTTLIVFALHVVPAGAQDHGDHRHVQPYAGQQTRAIKALSADQVGDLKKGAGMALALAAELNGYPGPKHAVELADRLGLSQAQRLGLAALTAAMVADAKAVGLRVIEAEAALDRAFAEGTIDRAKLTAMTRTIGALMGELRAIHLATHLEAKTILTEEQNSAYARHRGYVAD